MLTAASLFNFLNNRVSDRLGRRLGAFNHRTRARNTTPSRESARLPGASKPESNEPAQQPEHNSPPQLPTHTERPGETSSCGPDDSCRSGRHPRLSWATAPLGAAVPTSVLARPTDWGAMDALAQENYNLRLQLGQCQVATWLLPPVLRHPGGRCSGHAQAHHADPPPPCRRRRSTRPPRRGRCSRCRACSGTLWRRAGAPSASWPPAGHAMLSWKHSSASSHSTSRTTSSSSSRPRVCAAGSLPHPATCRPRSMPACRCPPSPAARRPDRRCWQLMAAWWGSAWLTS